MAAEVPYHCGIMPLGPERNQQPSSQPTGEVLCLFGPSRWQCIGVQALHTQRNYHFHINDSGLAHFTNLT
jgi:hypothetical protein